MKKIVLFLIFCFTVFGELNEELIFAASQNNTREVKKLISKGANPDLKRKNRCFLERCIMGFSQGKMEKKVFKEWTPLMYAAKFDNCEMADNLIKNGADIEKLNDNNMNALAIAIMNKSVKTVKLLIESGANVNKKVKKDKTLLMWAVSKNLKDVAAQLINNGANIELRDNSMNTPLLLAIKDNNKDMAELLLSRGAKIDVYNGFYNNPMSLAVKNDNKDIVKLLLKNGYMSLTDISVFETPVFYTLAYDSPKTATLLLKEKEYMKSINKFDFLRMAEAKKAIRVAEVIKKN